MNPPLQRPRLTGRQAPRDWRYRPLGMACLAVLMAGCASVSPDRLRGDVADRLAGQAVLAEVPFDRAAPSEQQVQAAINAALAQPLTQQQAVRIALLNHPGLKASLAALGIADADRVQALTLPNPHLSLGRLATGTERELERGITFSLLSLVTLPWRTVQAQYTMDQAVLATAREVVNTAAQARRAWVRAVAAEQIAATHERMHDAAQAGAELARRMQQVGNWSRLQEARERALLQSVRAQWARARLNAATEREQLNQALGLWGTQTSYQLPTQLPALPSSTWPADDLEATALRARLDLQSARRELAAQARQQGWAGASAVVGDIGLSYQRNTSTDRASGETSTTRGWELEVPLPLFDGGGTARTRAQAEVDHSAARLQQVAVRARSEVRSAWLHYRTAHDLARQQRQEVVPLQQFIADETLLRYNGMLVSVWDLLAQARASAQSVAQAIEAERDFWLADTDLQVALTGASPGTLQPLSSGANTAPPSPGH